MNGRCVSTAKREEEGKKRLSKLNDARQPVGAAQEEQMLVPQPSTPPAAWPPRCISVCGPPCARKPSSSSVQPSNPSSSDAGTQGTSARPVSAPQTGRATKNAAAAAQGPDADTSQAINWSVEAPLPSIQTRLGREQFLQTPAFVIAAHYERGETLRSKAHREELKGKLKQAAKHQKAVVKDKLDLEDVLRRTASELDCCKLENKQLKVQCQHMTEQLLLVQRSARDSKAAQSVLTPQVQGKLAVHDHLQHALVQAQNEVARLRAVLQAAGIQEP